METQAQPRVVEVELGVVGVFAHDELLPFAAAQRALFARILLGELGFRRGHELRGLALDLRPSVWRSGR